MKKMPKLRIPVAPPGKVMSSLMDYNRKLQSSIIAKEIKESE